MSLALSVFFKSQYEKVKKYFNLRGPWNIEEDYKLVCLYLKFGRKWSLMSRAIKGRN
jgi:hypothetical protein